MPKLGLGREKRKSIYKVIAPIWTSRLNLGTMSNHAHTPEPARYPVFTIGDRLRKARIQAGLSVPELAHRIGTNRNTVTRYELEKTEPKNMKNVYLKEWALATGVDKDWLLSGVTGPGPDGTPVTARLRGNNVTLLGAAKNAGTRPRDSRPVDPPATVAA